MIRLISILLACLVCMGAVTIYTTPESQSLYIYLLARKADGYKGPLAGSVDVGSNLINVDTLDFMPTEQQVADCTVPAATALCQAFNGSNANTTFKTQGIRSPICVGVCIGGGYVFATEIK